VVPCALPDWLNAAQAQPNKPMPKTKYRLAVLTFIPAAYQRQGDEIRFFAFEKARIGAPLEK